MVYKCSCGLVDECWAIICRLRLLLRASTKKKSITRNSLCALANMSCAATDAVRYSHVMNGPKISGGFEISLPVCCQLVASWYVRLKQEVGTDKQMQPR